MQRKNFSSGKHWEPIVEYLRAVRLGDFIYVSGTTATEKEVGSIIGAGNPYAQTTQIIKNIQMALQAVGASLKDVVRSRTYVTDIDKWQEVERVHVEYFKLIRPATFLIIALYSNQVISNSVSIYYFELHCAS
jgi:enamine deaminase RidA (YjgF/YER057c/UK114 family)